MIEKSDSNQLSLTTTSILEQPPRSLEDGQTPDDSGRSAPCCSCFNNSQCFVQSQKVYFDQGVPLGVNNLDRPLFLEFEESKLLWYFAIGYLLPVLSLCSGAVIGELIDHGLNFEKPELFSIIFALFGFSLSFQIKHWIITHHHHTLRPTRVIF